MGKAKYTRTERQGAIGDNTLLDRQRARLHLANRVRKDIPSRWDDSVIELGHLVEMLGLHTDFDPPPVAERRWRGKILDCGPCNL